MKAAANTTIFEFLAKYGFSKSSLLLAIAHDQSLQGLQWTDHAEDAAVSQFGFQNAISGNSVRRHGSISAFDGCQPFGTDVFGVVSACHVQQWIPLKGWKRLLLLQEFNCSLIGFDSFDLLEYWKLDVLSFLLCFDQFLFGMSVELEALESCYLLFQMSDDPFGLLSYLILQIEQFTLELLPHLGRLLLLNRMKHAQGFLLISLQVVVWWLFVWFELTQIIFSCTNTAVQSFVCWWHWLLWDTVIHCQLMHLWILKFQRFEYSCIGAEPRSWHASSPLCQVIVNHILLAFCWYFSPLLIFIFGIFLDSFHGGQQELVVEGALVQGEDLRSVNTPLLILDLSIIKRVLFIQACNLLLTVETGLALAVL